MGNALLKRRMKPFELLSFRFLTQSTYNQYSGVIVSYSEPTGSNHDYGTVTHGCRSDWTGSTAAEINASYLECTWDADFMNAYKSRLISEGYRYVNYRAVAVVDSIGSSEVTDSTPSDVNLYMSINGTSYEKDCYFSRQAYHWYKTEYNNEKTVKLDLTNTTFSTLRAGVYPIDQEGYYPFLVQKGSSTNQSRIIVEITFSKT